MSKNFQGRVVPDPPSCTDPKLSNLNLCKTPWWAIFIREFTVWQCPECSRKFRLEWHSAGADSTKIWARYNA